MSNERSQRALERAGSAKLGGGGQIKMRKKSDACGATNGRARASADSVF